MSPYETIVTVAIKIKAAFQANGMKPSGIVIYLDTVDWLAFLNSAEATPVMAGTTAGVEEVEIEGLTVRERRHA